MREPRYLINYESIAYGSVDPILVVEELVDRIDNPDFWRDGCCRRCERWDGKGRPSRPFAPNPLGPEGGCAGCIFSHLDENPDWRPDQAEATNKGFPARVVRPSMSFVRYESDRIVEAS